MDAVAGTELSRRLDAARPIGHTRHSDCRMDREMVQGPGQHSSVIRTALIAVFMACALAGQAAWASGETDAALQAYRDGNYPAAIKIWRKLAANDNPDAQYALGVAYLKGHGVEWNLTEAIAWFEQAAEAGHVSAMFNLCLLYTSPSPRDA